MKTILTFSLVMISVISFSQMSFNNETVTDYLEITVNPGNDGSPLSMSDIRDGQNYETVDLNGKIWMTENLKFETPNSYCYENLEENCDKYGRLYTWKEAQNVCPDGWHLPSDKEWEELVESLEGSYYAGTKFMLLETDVTKSVLGGWRTASGNFYNVQENGYFWTSTEQSEKFAWYRYVESSNSALLTGYHNKQNAFSVRCVKD